MKRSAKNAAKSALESNTAKMYKERFKQIASNAAAKAKNMSAKAAEKALKVTKGVAKTAYSAAEMGLSTAANVGIGALATGPIPGGTVAAMAASRLKNKYGNKIQRTIRNKASLLGKQAEQSIRNKAGQPLANVQRKRATRKSSYRRRH
jgi:hypothetical protein